MVKESSSNKKNKPCHEKTAAEKNKTSPKLKNKGSEIDEIFARKKRKISETGTNAKARKPAEESVAGVKSRGRTKMEKSTRTKDLDVNPFSGPISKSRKKTGDGLAIYTEEELGFGKADAGGTSLCPFDCECCF